MRRRLAALLLLAVAALAACGSDDAAPVGEDASLTEAALACLTETKGVDARQTGDEEIQLTSDEDGPRIQFFLNSGEAEAAQFEGDAEGAEQIGAALLFVDPELTPETERAVEAAEECLADQ